MMLLELAERCEGAAPPDRELDCLIFESRHLLLSRDNRGRIDGEPTGEYYGPNGDQLPERAPFYTASIDAAMTLVPENCEWECGTALLIGAAWAGVINLDGRWKGKAAAPALALCAAALRARAVIQPESKTS
jgi:hypothetical protein